MNVSTDAALSFLLVVTVKATVLLLSAALCSLAWRRASAAARHFLWTMVLAGLLLLPVLPVFLPAWGVPLLFTSGAALLVGSPQTAAYASAYPHWLLIVWFTGAALALGRLLIGNLAAYQLIRRAAPVASTS